MSNQFGVAGKSTRETGNRKYNVDLKFGIFILIMAIIIVVMIFNYRVLKLGWAGVLGLLVILYFLPSVLKGAFKGRKKEQEQYFQGAKGEEQVGEILAQLGNNFVVTHDVMKFYGDSPYGNIDHIVNDSKGNIFMLETKSHRGRVTSGGTGLLLNGHPFEKDILTQSLSNSYWLKERIEKALGIKAWITPVLVFTNAFVEFGKSIKGVYYTNKKYLLKFLQRMTASSAAGLKLWDMKKH